MSCINPKEYSKYEDVMTEYLTEKQGITVERAEAIAYNDWKQFFFENSSKSEAKLYSQITNHDGSIDVRFNGSYNSQRMKLVGVEDNGKEYTLSFQNPRSKKVSSYTFIHGQSRSKDSVFTKKDGTQGKQFVMVDNAGNVFGSSDDTNINKALYDKQELDLTNNIENSTKMLDKLKDIDGEDLSERHYKRLNNILGMFVNNYKQFIPAMNVYLYKEAEKVGGVLVLNEGIYLGVNDASKQVPTDISNSEMYVEEITHAATVFALKTGGPKAQTAKTRIQQLRDQVREEFHKEYKGESWRAFLPETSIDPKYEETRAKEMYDYIFNNEETGLEEFIAKGLTWEVFANKLDKIQVKKPKENEPKNLFESLIHWLDKLFSATRTFFTKEDFSTTATDVLIRMSAQLAEANNKAIKQRDDKKFISETFDRVDDIDTKLSNWVKKYLAKSKDVNKMPEQPKAGARGYEYALYFAKILPYLYGNPSGQIAIKELMNALGFKYGGDLQTLLQQSADPDKFDRVVEQLGQLGENIDRIRETTASVTAQGITAAFKKFTKTEKEALTLAGLDVDIQSIYDEYNVVDLLENEDVLKKEISNLRKEIRKRSENVKLSNYYIAQSVGLGYYLSTHQSKSRHQLLNATLIANAHNLPKNIQPTSVSKELIKLIDQLATMEGMVRTPQEAKNVLAELIKREPEGMKYTIGLSKGIIEEARLKTFSDELGMIKGYTKEIFDEDITLITRPVKDAKKLAKEGFIKVKNLPKAPGDTSHTPMAMYVNKWHAQQNLKKGALRYTDIHTKGTTIYDAHRADEEVSAATRSQINVLSIEKEGFKELRDMLNGTFDITKVDDSSLVPVYGRDGRVSNYRYMMDKESKRKYLRQDISAPAVMGRTAASIVDKVSTKEHNEKVLDSILEDMKNYNPKTGKGKDLSKSHRYFKLEKDSPDPQIREIWNLLPQEFKRVIRERGYKDENNNSYIAVRADLFKAYFGMREWGLLDVVGSIPLVGEMIVDLTPQEIKYVLRVAEHIWSQVVNMAKVNIIIKIPEVLIRNIISNIMIAPMRGHYNLLKVAQLQLKGATGLKDYINKTHELVKLENAKLAGNPNNLDIGKISSLREDLKKHQVADLIDEGMFQAIIEDVGNDEFKSSNRVARFFDNQLDKAPGFVKDGAHLLFLTEKTKYFEYMTMGTQFSDFASRYALYELDKERDLKKLHMRMGNKVRIKVADIPYFQEHEDKESYVTRSVAEDMLLDHLKKMVLDTHVNYGKLDGPILDWLNRIGLAMFTKYAFRIIRPNIKTAIEHPLYYFSTIGLQKMVGDIDDISDAFGNQFSKFGNTSAFTGLVDDLPAYQVLTNLYSLTK